MKWLAQALLVLGTLAIAASGLGYIIEWITK